MKICNNQPFHTFLRQRWKKPVMKIIIPRNEKPFGILQLIPFGILQLFTIATIHYSHLQLFSLMC